MSFIASMFSAVGDVSTSVLGLIGEALSGVTEIFYTTAEGGTITLTFLGEVLAWGAGISLVMAVIYLIVKLLRNVLARLSGGVRSIG